MNTFLRLLFALTVLAPAVRLGAAENCGCACCKDKPKGQSCCCFPPAAQEVATVKRHPLRGVVTAVHADRSALMVKHEEIPGVMRAMTMLFKVDAEVVRRVQKGQTITGQMSQVNDEWRLDEVRVATPATS